MSRQTAEHATTRAYVSGYLLSIGLTLAAYFMVTRQTATYHWLVAAIIGLAILQFIVQLVFFLHLRAETKPRWKLLVLVLMLLLVIILVGGTLWIMNNLNYHMKLTPQQINTYMQNQDNL